MNNFKEVLLKTSSLLKKENIKGDYYALVEYSPIVVNDVVYYENRRLVKEQYKRLDLFPNFNGDTILDIGCNTGYILIELNKHNNIGASVGIDQHHLMTNVANKIVKMENLKNLKFMALPAGSDEFKKLPQFDHVLFLSIAGKRNKEKFDELFIESLSKAKKSIYVEPTNHTQLSKKDYIDYWMDDLKKYGKVSYLGETDYQHRGIFNIKSIYI